MTSVFIVDDQATNRLLLSKLASSIEADVEVAAFGDPVRALAECGERAPDLIISDYKMGPMSGAEFICRLRAMGECHDIPIMVSFLAAHAIFCSYGSNKRLSKVVRQSWLTNSCKVSGLVKRSFGTTARY